MVTEDVLEMFMRLFDTEDYVPSHTRLPQIHSCEVLRVIEMVVNASKRLSDLGDSCLPIEMFHEANAQRRGWITRVDKPSFQPESVEDWVISGLISMWLRHSIRPHEPLAKPTTNTTMWTSQQLMTTTFHVLSSVLVTAVAIRLRLLTFR